MDKKEELLTEILKRVQRNYVHMVEIERLTKELGDAFSRNDRETVGLVMKMRQDEMDRVSEAKEEIQLLEESADEETGNRIASWLKGEDKYSADSFEAKKILELSEQFHQVLNRTITIDKTINLKLAGKDSYYQNTAV